MKSIELILLIASSWAITTVVGKSNLYTGWTMKFADNTPYQDQTAEVGDTITFIWTDDEVQNVFIHPTNDCNQTGRIPVGNQSPTTYIFTADDASPEGKEIYFVCDIGDRCEENGMRMSVTVFPSPDDASLEQTLDPVAINSSPVSLTTAPTEPLVTTAPVAATDAPVEPTIPPVAPTDAPVEPTIPPIASTGAPVAPTLSPIEPSEAPVEPTDALIEPSGAPVAPTLSPIEPSEAPIAPTDSPIEPTEAPIEPTNPPTDAPVAPVSYPTVPPTASPTNSPTKAPTPSPTTFSPTPSPPIATGIPTISPTPIPSVKAVEPVAGPTESPTISPTPIPSAKAVEPVAGPTESPTISQSVDEPSPAETKKTMRGLQMTVGGISSFSDSTMNAWKDTTENFSTSHYKSDFSGSTFKTTITVTNSQKVSQRYRSMMRGQRVLQTQGSGFVITYNQLVSYDSTADDITENYLAKSAFASPEQRNDYVQSLQDSGDPVLDTATDATAPEYANDNVATSVPAVTSKTQAPTSAGNDPVLSMAAIIGIACGGGALLIIIILFFIYCNKKVSKENPNIDSNPPPKSVSLKEDEVSTLAGPSVTGGGALGDRSVGTVDYDYSKAYGNGDTSVSSAGGTFGSNTQNISLPANAAATGAALGPYDDDGSYDANFHNPGNNVKEEILHIFAPPGKLGVVIDTPDDGAPVVHAVKDSSVVVDKVQVGDKLVAVDDEDVRTLTAIKVSKLISRKSANPSRKLTILRTTLIE